MRAWAEVRLDRAAKNFREVRRAQRALTLLGGRAERDTVYRLTPDVPRRLIVVRKISQTPTKYPRASAQIAKKPL